MRQCWAGDEAPNLKTKDAILCCLIRAIAHFKEEIDKHGAIVECLVDIGKAKETQRKYASVSFRQQQILGTKQHGFHDSKGFKSADITQSS
jgi:hypothetical protein